jgi:hypothetical protein
MRIHSTCSIVFLVAHVFVAHVFKSDHDKNQPVYTCVIGAKHNMYTIVCLVPKNTIEQVE